jgi:hypothetical protein
LSALASHNLYLTENIGWFLKLEDNRAPISFSYMKPGATVSEITGIFNLEDVVLTENPTESSTEKIY